MIKSFLLEQVVALLKEIKELLFNLINVHGHLQLLMVSVIICNVKLGLLDIPLI